MAEVLKIPSNVTYFTLSANSVGPPGPQGPIGPVGPMPDNPVLSVSGKTGDVLLTKSDVSLSNVDNTSDTNKPISNATQTALNAKADKIYVDQQDNTKQSTLVSGTNIKTVGGISLLGSGDVPFPITLDATTSSKGVIQLSGDLGGTATAPTVPGLADKEPTIPTGSSSQYIRGDKTLATMDKAAVGLSNVDNTTDLSKPVSIATQDALNLKENNIAPGTTAQYWRGDKTWQQFPEFDPARVITQSAHGFSVGEVLRFNGTAYVLAKADSVDNAEVIGIVKDVVNANTFKLAVSGYVNGLSGLTIGVNFLSPATAGALTTIEPNSSGQISKPILIADSATSGYFFNFRGFIIGSGGTVGITEEDATALAIAL